MLTLIGAAIGLALAAGVLRAFNVSGLIAHTQFAAQPPDLPLRSGDRRLLRPLLGRLSGLADVEAPPRPSAPREVRMIRHLFKLVWNRKRSNALMILEICVSFLVVFGVATLGLFFLDNYRRAARVRLEDRSGASASASGAARRACPARELRRAAGDLRAAAAGGPGAGARGGGGGFVGRPLRSGRMVQHRTRSRGRRVDMDADRATVGFDKAMGLELVAGRWFEEADAALAWRPIVIDRDLARAAYGAENPVGKPFAEPAPESARSASSAW